MATKVRDGREREQGDPFRIPLARNSDERAKVNRRTFVKLNPGQPAGARFLEQRGLKQSAVQTIERIVTSESLGTAVFPKVAMGGLEISRHFGARWQATRDTALVLES